MIETLSHNESQLKDIELLNNKTSSIRFYKWDKPTISIGCSQKQKIDNAERRLTGGSSLYCYNTELMFSIVLPLYNKPSLILKEINTLILEVLNETGVKCNLNIANSSDKYKSEECFNAIGKSELAIDNKKLFGSATKIINNMYLQQCIMYIEPSYLKLKEFTIEDSSLYKDRQISLQELNIIIDLKTLVTNIYTKVNKIIKENK